MARRRFGIRDTAKQARKILAGRLASARIDNVLVSQAKRRIEQSGDSQHRYPQLWVDRVGITSYRSGGKPLWDTATHIYNRISGVTRTRGVGQIRFMLRSSLIGAYHQAGFKTKGPNYIPLTRRAARASGSKSAKARGYRFGEDYIMAWRGVTVPQRKLFNLPPENQTELRDSVARALRG